MTDALLNIPAFLQRPPGPPRRVSHARKRRPGVPKYRGQGRVRINLGATGTVENKYIMDGGGFRIGFGQRLVEVLTKGRKWVTVRYWPGGPNADAVRHRFSLHDWGLVSQAENDHA